MLGIAPLTAGRDSLLVLMSLKQAGNVAIKETQEMETGRVNLPCISHQTVFLQFLRPSRGQASKQKHNRVVVPNGTGAGAAKENFLHKDQVWMDGQHPVCNVHGINGCVRDGINTLHTARTSQRSPHSGHKHHPNSTRSYQRLASSRHGPLWSRELLLGNWFAARPPGPFCPENRA